MIINNKQENVVTLIMAAGKSVNSKKSKLVQKIYDKELIKRVLESAQKIGSDEIVTVVGYQKEQIQETLGDLTKYVVQENPLGTAHAVMKAEEYLKDKDGKVLILYGDVPLIRPETLQKLINRNVENNEDATVLTAVLENPTGYGRIVRNEDGELEKIVEEKDATSEEREIKEINSGIYCFDIQKLLKALKKVNNDNSKKEYFLVDVIKIMNDEGLKTGAMVLHDNSEILGVNDEIQLELLTKILRMRINSYHMKNGVIIEDSASTHIYDNVEIGSGTVIHPNTIIKSGNVIGENCEIGPNAFIREKCELANNVKIGNNVEIKKVKVGEKSKVPHFIYLGDCEVGKNCNIGCGTITCNYDGKEKHKTIIGDNCFIGSNVNLVAPVKIGDNSKIAAGSTITEDVPENTLAIARQRQINKIDYLKK